MNDALILELLGLTATLIAIATPIIKLNGSIVKLNVTIESFQKSIDLANQKNDKQDETLSNHEIRIVKLESKN